MPPGGTHGVPRRGPRRREHGHRRTSCGRVLPRDDLALDRKLVAGEGHGLAGEVIRNAGELNITLPGLITATQPSGFPLPEPMRVSAGFEVIGLSGKTLIHTFPPRLILRVIATRAASIWRLVIHPRSRAFSPYSPNATVLPPFVFPRRRPRICLRCLTRLGISIRTYPPRLEPARRGAPPRPARSVASRLASPRDSGRASPRESRQASPRQSRLASPGASGQASAPAAAGAADRRRDAGADPAAGRPRPRTRRSPRGSP